MPTEIESSSFSRVLVALRDGLREREGLQGVQITADPMGNETDPRESVWFADVEFSQEWGSVGNMRRDESYTLNGSIWVERPGAGEDKADEVRDRAVEILAEIEAFLRLKVRFDRTFKGAELERGRGMPGFNDGGRIYRIDFAIRVNESLQTL